MRTGDFLEIQTCMLVAVGSEALARLFGAAARVVESDSNWRGGRR